MGFIVGFFIGLLVRWSVPGGVIAGVVGAIAGAVFFAPHPVGFVMDFLTAVAAYFVGSIIGSIFAFFKNWRRAKRPAKKHEYLTASGEKSSLRFTFED